MKKKVINVEFTVPDSGKTINSRRRFLRNSGLLVAGTGLFMYSCSTEDEQLNESLDAEAAAFKKRADETFNLGKGDVAILNYAYILEQLEAAFYTEVINLDGFSSMFNQEEQEILRDLYAHEVIHRDFFLIALQSVVAPGKIAPSLSFNFGDIFGSRESILTIAQVLEDTGVAAYNGAGNLLENPAYLLVAGKIVSVEARHASAIRDLIGDDTNFASDDVLVDLFGTGQAYDKALDPKIILEQVAATGFLETKIIANNIPTE